MYQFIREHACSSNILFRDEPGFLFLLLLLFTLRGLKESSKLKLFAEIQVQSTRTGKTSVFNRTCKITTLYINVSEKMHIFLSFIIQVTKIQGYYNS